MRRRLLASALLIAFLAWPVLGADSKPIKVLIITGDHQGHDWRKTTPFLKDLLTKAGMKVDVTETPAKDVTAANLAKYDVLLLNYKDTRNGAPRRAGRTRIRRRSRRRSRVARDSLSITTLRQRSPAAVSWISNLNR